MKYQPTLEHMDGRGFSVRYAEMRDKRRRARKNAEKIIEKAKKLNIGNMQSPKLARAIYYTCEIGDEILSKLYNAVAIALAYIYKLDKGEKIDKPEIEIPDDLIFDEFGNKNV